MDTTMKNEESLTLREYISQYSGHQRFTRLFSIIERGNVAEERIIEAIQLGWKFVSETKALGMGKKLNDLVGKHFKDQNKNIPASCTYKGNDQQLQSEFDKKIKRTAMEIQSQQKSLIKDQLRITNKEQGYNYFEHGFLNEATQYFIRSHDMASEPEEQFKLKFLIARCGNMSGQDYTVQQFSQGAISMAINNHPEEMAAARVLDAIQCLSQQNFSHAILKLLEVQLPNMELQNSIFAEICTFNDLAYYIALSALTSCGRQELKNTVLKHANFATLTQDTVVAANIIEQFLNGNYVDFQQSLQQIQTELKYDQIFGEHNLQGQKIFRMIRLKALNQHVQAYQVISMKEISEDFGITIPEVETDLAELIKDGKLSYRIDQFTQLLHKKVPDQKLQTLAKTQASGEHYLNDTRTFLMRINMIRYGFVNNAATSGNRNMTMQTQMNDNDFM